TTDRVDTASDRRARNLAPVRERRAQEDLLDRVLGDVPERIGVVRDQADRVTSDPGEDQAARVAGCGVARGLPHRDAAVSDVRAADVGPAVEDLEADLPALLRLDVLPCELDGQWVDRGRSADRDYFLRLRRGRYGHEHGDGGEHRRQAKPSS